MGHAARIFVGQHFCRALDRLRFVAKESGGADLFLKRGRGDFQVIFRLSILAKQIGSHNVDPRIGALCGKDGSNQQLKRVGVIERTFRARIGAFQCRDDLAGLLFELGIQFLPPALPSAPRLSSPVGNLFSFR